MTWIGFGGARRRSARCRLMIWRVSRHANGGVQGHTRDKMTINENLREEEMIYGFRCDEVSGNKVDRREDEHEPEREMPS